MHKIKQVEALEGYRLKLCFMDGETGEVDLSNLAGRGVFAAWKDYAEFRKVTIGDSGDLVWPSGVDLCPDALYFSMTGKRPEEEFSALHIFAAILCRMCNDSRQLIITSCYS